MRNANGDENEGWNKMIDQGDMDKINMGIKDGNRKWNGNKNEIEMKIEREWDTLMKISFSSRLASQAEGGVGTTTPAEFMIDPPLVCKNMVLRAGSEGGGGCSIFWRNPPLFCVRKPGPGAKRGFFCSGFPCRVQIRSGFPSQT